MKQPITISLEDLAGISPALREQIRGDFARRRLMPKGIFDVNLARELGDDMYLSGSDDEEVPDVKPEEVREYRDFPAPVVSVNLTLDAGAPLGALVVSDPVTQFLESLPPEERSKVIVATDLESL